MKKIYYKKIKNKIVKRLHVFKINLDDSLLFTKYDTSLNFFCISYNMSSINILRYVSIFTAILMIQHLLKVSHIHLYFVHIQFVVL